MADADEQDTGHPDGRGESYAEAIVTFEEREADAGRHSLAGATDEPVGLARLLAEGLDHAQGPQRLLHHGQRRTLQPLRMPRLAPHARAIDARHEEQRRRDDQGDQRELPVQPRGDGDHRHQGDRRRDERNDAFDHNILDRGGVLLDAVDGVGGSPRVVIRGGQTLDLFHEAGSEIEDEPLPDIGAQQRAGEGLHLTERRHGHEQPDREQQDRIGGPCGSVRDQRPQERRQRVSTQNGIHHDLERHRSEQRDRAREQPEPGQDREVKPVRTRLAQQPLVENDAAHHARSSLSRPRPRVIVAMAAPHCSSVRTANSSATRPRTAAAGHASS